MSDGARSGSAAAIPRNTAWLLGARLLSQVLAIGLTVLLAARIGLVGFGEYAFVSAVVFVGNVVTTFGTDMVLIRDIAGRGRMERCAAALALQLALSAVVIAAVWMGTAALGTQHAGVVGALRIMSLSLLPTALFSVCTAALRGSGLLRAYAAVTVAAAAAPLLAVAALVRPGAGVVRAAGMLVLAQAAIGVVAWVTCACLVPGARVVSRVSLPEVAEMARSSASIGALGMLGVAYQRCGAIAVTLFAGPAATGWFAGASRVVEASKTGHVALFTAVYPAMAEAAAAPASSRVALRRSWRLSLGGAAIIAAGLLLAGPALIDRLYGPAFGPAKSGLAILALSVVPSTVATYQSLSLLAADRERDTLRVLAISLAVLVVMTVTLVPAAGWIGACWAMLIADTTNAALMLVATRARVRSAVTTRRALLSPVARARGGYR